MKLDDLAMRPALSEIMQRQERVLTELTVAFPDEQSVDAWTIRATQASVGRLGEGIIDILLNPEFVMFTHDLVRDKGPAGERFRARLGRALQAEYARAIEDLSRISHEAFPGAGTANGAIQPPRATANFR